MTITDLDYPVRCTACPKNCIIYYLARAEQAPAVVDVKEEDLPEDCPLKKK